MMVVFFYLTWPMGVQQTEVHPRDYSFVLKLRASDGACLDGWNVTTILVDSNGNAQPEITVGV
jgi:hypothetical protein